MPTNYSVFESPPPAVLEQAVLENPEPRRMSYHLPVLPAEVLVALQPRPGRLILDGTLGGGGHAGLLLQTGARVIGMDRDEDALREAQRKLAGAGDRFQALHGNFAEAAGMLEQIGVTAVDGVLLDLGVSSHQLDTGGRGFSFQSNGPLDMRMDRSQGLTAADLINSAPVEELVRIFRDYGEEPKAARVASRIAHQRALRRIETTFDLVAAVDGVLRKTGPRHPATRIFQALRIAVNSELESLREGLECLAEILKPGGRFAVISFHSLEDRIVKHFFRDRATEWLDRPEWPEPRRNPLHSFRHITPSPEVASPSEQASNPRSRSAKLRVAEKLPTR